MQQTPLATIINLREPQRKALKKLRIETAEDLLYHFPTRYENPSEARIVTQLTAGSEAVVFGRVHSLKTLKASTASLPKVIETSPASFFQQRAVFLLLYSSASWYSSSNCCSNVSLSNLL